MGLSMSHGRPDFSLICYKSAEESQPVTVIPLDNARMVVETGGFTEAGVLVSPSPFARSQRSCVLTYLLMCGKWFCSR